MYDAVVVGAGLAGTAAAAGLARRGRRVLLLEADRYPVHKMCGEFLSPESSRVLAGIGVDGAIRASGAVAIRRVAVTSRSGACWRGRLPSPGTGLSRWALDPLLFDAARALGAEGRQGARVASVERAPKGTFVVRWTEGERREQAEARLVVGAFGKRSVLDRTLGRESFRDGGDFVAFKAHHVGADLGDWVELHAFDGGYCGMSHVEGGRVNVCLIARTSVLRDAGRSFEAMREGPMRANPVLAERLAALEPVSEIVAIGRIPFATKELFAGGVMMVGDSAGMIAPLCGDGMAIALRSAEIATGLADDFLGSGSASLAPLERAYERAWRREFSARLRVGRALQSALFRPVPARLGLGLLARAPWLGRALVAATRGA